MQSNNTSQNDRRQPAPKGMPTTPPQNSPTFSGRQKPRDVLPEQKPITDDELITKKPSVIKHFLKIFFSVIALVIAVVFVYLFFLLGEPTEEVKQAVTTVEESIQMPMHAIESPGDSNIQTLADTFDQPVLALFGSELAMQKSRIYDTAFQGGYARRVTITYAFADGTPLLLESIRPTAAIALLGSPDYRLKGGTLYTLGGINAARMDSKTQICIFGQGDGAAYALTCSQAHAEEITTLLRQVGLTPPSVTN